MSDTLQLGQQAYRDGRNAYDAGDLDAARQAFRTALEHIPEDPQAWFALGNCYDNMKRPVQAELCFRKCLQFSEAAAKPQVFFNLGNSLLDQGKLQQAIDCYTHVDEQCVAYASAQKNLELARRALQ